jgi:hypothetical protein
MKSAILALSPLLPRVRSGHVDRAGRLNKGFLDEARRLERTRNDFHPMLGIRRLNGSQHRVAVSTAV